tara:strand:- start:1776 stop:2165 length:390 start_codon:yes stop_codon:yes gene_type:complete
MKYKTHNDKEICTDGTWLQGHVYCSYETLVSLFGEPSERYDDYKCDAHWDVELEDGEVATIYNWKNGINYCGVKDGIPTEKITEWNIGGNTHKVAFAINHLTNHSLMMQVQGLKHNLELAEQETHRLLK